MIRAFLRSLRLLSRRHKIIFFGLLLIRVAINFLDIFGLMAIGVLGAMLVSGFSDRPSATFVGIQSLVTTASVRPRNYDADHSESSNSTYSSDS